MVIHPPRRRRTAAAATGLVVAALAVGLVRAEPLPLDKRLVEEEKQREAVIEKVRPTVVALFAAGGNNGGSGVVVSEDGFVLTNFHVVEATGPVMKCGLSDGVLYDGVLVGLDKVGDVALVKLLPKKEGDKFPFAVMGDSDKVRAGDWSLAMGNPFLLATDFTPTVTYGLVSGVHRYQYPSGTLLEYGDCIQIDTSINPGNSGGPLFNMDGELIGINGRGSFEKRGRVNSGVGYAISINQIKNFWGQLRAGMDTDHASLGALVAPDNDETALGKLLVKNLIDCDASRRGLEIGDEVVSFAGRRLSSVNQFKNTLAIFPRGWRLPLVYRHGTEKREVLVRLMGVQRQELLAQPEAGGPPPAAPPPIPSTPAAKLYEPKPGYTNFHFNRVERDALLKEFRDAFGDARALQGNWTIKGSGTIKARRGLASVNIVDKGASDKASELVVGIFDGLDYSLEPLVPTTKAEAMKDPRDSGGVLVALYQYRQLLALDMKGAADFSHGGVEPFYLPPPEKERPDYAALRVDCDVLRSRYAGIPAKWYFARQDDDKRGIKKRQLIGFEVYVDREWGTEPCEVHLLDYQKVGDRTQPTRIVVRYNEKTYCNLGEVTITAEKAAK